MLSASTSSKRKLECDSYASAKHQRCNGTEPDMLDVDMGAEPTQAQPVQTYSPSSECSPITSYPHFELYPDINLMDCSPDSSTPNTPVDSPSELDIGLLQPKLASSFQHHGNCSQIPKLRIAQHAGLNGSRSLWSHCMQCGALEMVQC